MPIAYNAPYEDPNWMRAYLGGIDAAKQFQANQAARAIQWQGTQEYNSLVQGGMDPREALQRVAPRLFFSDPRALSGALPSLLTQPGGLYTDPSGRQFTVDRWGVPRALPQEQLGWTTYQDPDTGQIFKVPIQRNQPTPTQTGPVTPPVVTMPDGTQYFVSPGKPPQRVMPNPNATVQVPTGPLGVKVPTPTGKYILDVEKAKVQDKLSRWEQLAGRVARGEKESWLATDYFTNQLKAIEADLAAEGWSTNGTPLPGTDLHEKVYGQRGVAPTPGQSPYQLTPPAAPVTPPAATPAPAGPPAPVPVPQPGGGVFPSAPGRNWVPTPTPGIIATQPRTVITTPAPTPAAPAPPTPTPPPGGGINITLPRYTPTPATVRPPTRNIQRRRPDGTWERVPGSVSRQAMQQHIERNKRMIIEQIGPPPAIQLPANQGLFITADEFNNPRYGIFNIQTGEFVGYAD
jgi:hypothetical protein